MTIKTLRLTLLALLTLCTFMTEPAFAQRGRGFRSAPRVSAPRSTRLNAPSFRPRTIPLNSYRRYSRYRSPNPFANLFPWFFLWSATSNRGEAQEQEDGAAENGQTGQTADRVVGINLGVVFVVIVGVILLFGAVMFYVGIRQSGP